MLSKLNGRSRLRSRLAIIIAAALAPAGVLALVQAQNAVVEANISREESFERATLIAIDEERVALASMKQVIRLAAVSVDVEWTVSGECARTFDAMREAHEWLTTAVLLDPAGDVICGDDLARGFAEDEIWRRFKDGGDFDIARAAPRPEQHTALEILQRLPGATEQASAYALAIGVRMGFLASLAEPRGQEPTLALIDRGGETLLLGGREPKVRDDDWLPTDRSPLLSFGDRTIDGVGADGVARTYFTSAIEPGRLWAVSAREPLHWSRAVFGREGRIVLIPILFWIIAVAVAFFAIDTLVTRHVSRLRRVATRIGAGELNAEVGDFTDAPSELKALASSISVMGANLSSRETELRRTLEVQRRLLLEIHHRVKNNLQTISSIMNIEMRRARDPAGKAVVKTIQDRIHALAMVHQNLYVAENLEEVALEQLTRDVGEHLTASLKPSGRSVRLEFELDEMTVDTNVATPIALYLSEGLGFALAEIDESETVRVRLVSKPEEFRLEIEASFAEPSSDDLSYKLMEGFARQIGGRLERKRKGDRQVISLVAPRKPQAQLFAVRSAAAAGGR